MFCGPFVYSEVEHEEAIEARAEESEEMDRTINECNLDAYELSYGCGLIVDFERLHPYIPPVSPISDIRYVDYFNPVFLKTEHIMIRVNDEFQFAEFSVRHFCKPNEFLLRAIAELKSPADANYRFIERIIYSTYSRFPNFNFIQKDADGGWDAGNSISNVKVCADANVALEDICVFNFINLVIIMKYIKILENFDIDSRATILKDRKPLLKDYMPEDSVIDNPRALEYYEWFLSLMETYSEHNAELYEKSRNSCCPESGYPFLMPFVGAGPMAEFKEIQHKFRTDFDEDLENKVKIEPGLMADESENTPVTDDVPTRVILSPKRTRSVAIKEEQPTETTEAPLEETENKKIRKESDLFNEALSNMILEEYDDPSQRILDIVETLKEISYETIMEMNTDLEATEKTLTAVSNYKDTEWELIRRYVRMCKKVFIGDGLDERIDQAKTKGELNDIRLSYMEEYKQMYSGEKPMIRRKRALCSCNSIMTDIKIENTAEEEENTILRRDSPFSFANQIPSPPSHLHFDAEVDVVEPEFEKPAIAYKKRRCTIFL